MRMAKTVQNSLDKAHCEYDIVSTRTRPAALKQLGSRASLPNGSPNQ